MTSVQIKTNTIWTLVAIFIIPFTILLQFIVQANSLEKAVILTILIICLIIIVYYIIYGYFFINYLYFNKDVIKEEGFALLKPNFHSKDENNNNSQQETNVVSVKLAFDCINEFSKRKNQQRG
jgi:flagellar basal body-associated protein FliL